jgi:hypothetical protein
MNKKLLIFSFPDRNPEYLQLQIDSYNKYMNDGNSEFIIINASTSYSNQVEEICKINNIKCIYYDGNRNVSFSNHIGFSNYFVEQLNWFRETIQKNTNDYIMMIHSDMFFINKINYKKLMSEKKLYFNPQYRDNFNLFYMWDGILLFDSEYFNKNDLTKYFVWNGVPGSDVGGETHNLLLNIDKSFYNFFEMWNIYDLSNNKFDTHLNGNIRYTFQMGSNSLNESKAFPNKSFPYEIERENYDEYYTNNFYILKELFIDNYNFINPIHIDIIQLIDEDLTNSPILHFKSGSGYQPFYNPSYANHKLDVIKKIIFRDEDSNIN